MDIIDDIFKQITAGDIKTYKEMENHLDKKYGYPKGSNSLRDLKKSGYIAGGSHSGFLDIPDGLTLNPLTITANGYNFIKNRKNDLSRQRENRFERNQGLLAFLSIIIAIIFGLLALAG